MMNKYSAGNPLFNLTIMVLFEQQYIYSAFIKHAAHDSFFIFAHNIHY